MKVPINKDVLKKALINSCLSVENASKEASISTSTLRRAIREGNMTISSAGKVARTLKLEISEFILNDNS